ncbi:DUF4283 domain-containing protein/zf-CCHC_4 domain-containing protein, partial [Cephalotus follicularis]
DSMEEGMVRLWERLKLNEEEGGEIYVDEIMIDNINPKGFFCLIGSLWIAKKFNKETLKNTMKTLWRAKYCVRIRDDGNNMFLFMFNNEEDRMKVLKCCPWLFDKHIILLEKIEGEVHPSTISLHKATLCIRVFGVPYMCLSERVGRIIKELISELEEVIVISGKKDNNQYFKLGVEIDVHKPLRRGIKLLVGSMEKTWLPFQYKKLPNLCNFYGRVAHTVKEYELLKQKETMGKQVEFHYGSWLWVKSFRLGKSHYYQGVWVDSPNFWNNKVSRDLGGAASSLGAVSERVDNLIMNSKSDLGGGGMWMVGHMGIWKYALMGLKGIILCCLHPFRMRVYGRRI